MRPFISSASGRLAAKFLIDLALWVAAALIAALLRLEGDFDGGRNGLLLFALISLPVKAALIYRFGLYRQRWRKVGVRDLRDLVKAVGSAVVVLFGVGLVLYSKGGFPRSIPIIDGAVALIALGGVRMLVRIGSERGRAQPRDGDGARVLLVGAGEAGTRLAREMQRHPESGLRPVGFLDDDAVKRRHRFLGLEVVGAIDDLPRMVHETNAQEVLIAIPSAPGTVVRRVVDLARAAKVRFRVLPGVHELLTGGLGLSNIRDVRVEDLLRREPNDFETADVAEYVQGRVVLVSGAGGSIGSELVRQIVPFGPARVILLGRGENSLFEFDRELEARWPQVDRTVVVGNVCDREKMQDVFHRFSPDVVFHAAAHKHVPLMESHPDEAVLNNVGGTKTLAETALEFRVERFVNISTDKAVNPTSMVGGSKRIAEYLVRAIAEEAGPEQAFISVRFGNVLGSRGSVVRVFQEQIRAGGPVTLTHPDMTRYLMTIPEASQLVVQAAALGRNGAVYVLDMGDPVLVHDLARDLIQLSGYRPDQDIDIVHTGIRPGEKLHEELFAAGEETSRTRHKSIFVSSVHATHPPELSVDAFSRTVDDLLQAAKARDRQRMLELFAQLVPTYAGLHQNLADR